MDTALVLLENLMISVRNGGDGVRRATSRLTFGSVRQCSKGVQTQLLNFSTLRLIVRDSSPLIVRIQVASGHESGHEMGKANDGIAVWRVR